MRITSSFAARDDKGAGVIRYDYGMKLIRSVSKWEDPTCDPRFTGEYILRCMAADLGLEFEPCETLDDLYQMVLKEIKRRNIWIG